MITDALSEYRADWVLSGKAPSTVDTHIALLRRFAVETSTQTVEEARQWIVAAPTRSMQRKRAQSLRSFGRWSYRIGDNDLPWWEQIRVPVERERPQPTATAQDFSEGLQRLFGARDRAILGLLWGTCLRRSEVARLQVADVNLSDVFLIVRTSKNGKPRMVPLPPITARLLRRYLRQWSADSLFGLGPDGIRLVLRRHGLLPAHAWRRGWAVEALRFGVSEASVRSAAGWSSGAMVARYTRAKAGELALDEFRRSWST
jgi:integrase